MELPPELWERIFWIINCDFSWTDVKEASLACQLFRDICQGILFQELTLSPIIGVDYKNSAFSSSLVAGRTSQKQVPAAVEAWDWEAWEKDMHRTFRSDRRLDIIGNHSFLATRLRILTLRGYGIRWYRYPSDPFTSPERRALTKAVFDAFLCLRRTLTQQLHHFTHLRRLELSQYPVDDELLRQINSHPTLNELKFNFCWYPVSTSPLTSITSMSFGHIPTTHGLPWVPPVGPSPYAHVPDHHISSAYELISPEDIEQLDFTFGPYDSNVGHALEHLSARMERGKFRRLRKLNLQSSYYPPETPTLLRQLFAWTPVLRELHITQSFPLRFALEGSLPQPCMPKLETLSCPLDWARFLVPGRPVGDIRVWVVDEDTSPSFLAHTESELDKLLRPLALSTMPVTTLHLPEYPPLAPVWLLMPYITAVFPAVLDLRVAIAGESMNVRQIWRCGTRTGPPLPSIDTTEEVVEGDLLEKLIADVQGVVDAELSGGEKVVLRPISKRILAHRGITEDNVEMSKEPRHYAPSMGIRQGMIMAPSIQDRSRWSTPTASRPSTPIQDFDEHPLAWLHAFFDDVDDRGFPTNKPETQLLMHAQDVLVFFARGYYPLPPALQSLSVVNCFGTSTRWSHIQGIEHYELCLRTALEEVSERHIKLSSYYFANDGNFGPSPYRRLERHHKEDLAELNSEQPRWERRGDPW